ncbi:MAG: hypothetical protein ACE367_17955 [Acidimicrobiales bacterium]
MRSPVIWRCTIGYAIFRVLGVDSRTAAAVAVGELVAGPQHRAPDQPAGDH